MKAAGALVLVSLAFVPAAAGHRLGGAPLAYVAAEDDDRLAVVDLGSRSVVRRLAVADGPHNVAATFDGRVVAVTSPPAGVVTVVDGRSLRVRRTFSGFGYPHDVKLSADGRTAWVTDERRDRVGVLDLRAGRVRARSPVADAPHDLVVTDRVLVTHGPSGSALTVIDPAHRRVVGRIAVGRGPHDITFQPDSANVFVTYWRTPDVGRIDWGRRRIVYRRRLGGVPHHVQFDYLSGRHLWVSDHSRGVILRLRSADGSVFRRYRGCPGAHHVALPGVGLYAVAACHDSGRLLVIARNGRTATIPVGHGLHGVAVAVVP